ncbi:hypothetical protein Mgra_00004969 [Meloidogyne graminicola]|uniref:C2H2-type domain-containing protein n=1 Tax=Meloidogyne graminicola TaxID=189291 RepID=A0A8S9ZQR7_9BILA|nr:hypothetical protein Mgra_00004969 [Meloidogyne graminicola]
MTSSLSPSPIISSNIDTTTTTLNNTNKCTIQSPILYSNNPLYQKMKEFILDLCEQGIGAIESNEQIKIKYGVQAPTLCTIYKWRKEYRGGKFLFYTLGEKQILDNINIPTETMDLQQSQQNGKVIKKEFEKYCAECNREMSSRHYYEFHMLNVHDVLLGTTRATVELLGKMSSTRKQQLIFRCDSCSGVGKDYNNFEELQQHKINEHGEHLRIPALHFKKNNNKNNSSPPGKMKAHPKLARSFTTIGRGRDISLPLPTEGLRRSARIPKPTSAIIHSFFSAKDEIDSDVGGEQRKIKDLNKNDNNNGINRTLQGLKEEEARKDAQMNDCFKGRNWEIKEGNLGTKIFSKFVNKNKNNKNASLLKNSINEQKVSQEEEPFVTILNDGRIEVEETESKKAKNTQEKHQIISPSALEASDSMLMALASAALMEKVRENLMLQKLPIIQINPPTTLQASINNSTFPHSST